MKRSEICEFVFSMMEKRVGEFEHLEAVELRDAYIDSLDIVEISMEVEREYRISIASEVIERYVTVQDIVDSAITELEVKNETVEQDNLYGKPVFCYFIIDISKIIC